MPVSITQDAKASEEIIPPPPMIPGYRGPPKVAHADVGKNRTMLRAQDTDEFFTPPVDTKFPRPNSCASSWMCHKDYVMAMGMTFKVEMHCECTATTTTSGVSKYKLVESDESLIMAHGREKIGGEVKPKATVRGSSRRSGRRSNVHPKTHGTVKGDPTVTMSMQDMPEVKEAASALMKSGMPMDDIASVKLPCNAKYDQAALTNSDPYDAPALIVKSVAKIEKSHAQGPPPVNSGKAKLVSGGVTVTGISPIEDGSGSGSGSGLYTPPAMPKDPANVAEMTKTVVTLETEIEASMRCHNGKLWCVSVSVCLCVCVSVCVCVICIYTYTYTRTYVHTYRHTDIQTYRHTYIHTHRHTDIQTDRQTCRHTYIYI